MRGLRSSMLHECTLTAFARLRAYVIAVSRVDVRLMRSSEIEAGGEALAVPVLVCPGPGGLDFRIIHVPPVSNVVASDSRFLPLGHVTNVFLFQDT
jgi:hypothetical protein